MQWNNQNSNELREADVKREKTYEWGSIGFGFAFD